VNEQKIFLKFVHEKTETRIRFDFKSWIRIRIETSSDPKRCLYAGAAPARGAGCARGRAGTTCALIWICSSPGSSRIPEQSFLELREKSQSEIPKEKFK